MHLFKDFKKINLNFKLEIQISTRVKDTDKDNFNVKNIVCVYVQVYFSFFQTENNVAL